MHSNDFYHIDVHPFNFCYKKTSLKKIKCLGLSIPTFGYIYSIIDYSDVMSTKFKLSTDEQKQFIYKNLKYEDNIKFLLNSILFANNNMIDIIYKIIIKDTNISEEQMINLFYDKKLTFEETKLYCKYANDAPKLIKYFYKLIKTT